jgi:hypothetical protein
MAICLDQVLSQLKAAMKQENLQRPRACGYPPPAKVMIIVRLLQTPRAR